MQSHIERLDVKAIQALSNSTDRIRPVIASLQGNKGDSWRHEKIDYSVQDNTQVNRYFLTM